MCNTLQEFLIPDSRTNRPSRTNPYVFNNEIPKIKPYVSDSLELNRIPETGKTIQLPNSIIVKKITINTKKLFYLSQTRNLPKFDNSRIILNNY